MSNENIEIDPYALVMGDEFIHNSIGQVYKAVFTGIEIVDNKEVLMFKYTPNLQYVVSDFNVDWRFNNFIDLLKRGIIKPVKVFQLEKHNIEFIEDKEYMSMII